MPVAHCQQDRYSILWGWITNPQNAGESMETTWTPERVERLAQLFAEGLSTAEIGRRLGLTKNAVIGRLYGRSVTPMIPIFIFAARGRSPENRIAPSMRRSPISGQRTRTPPDHQITMRVKAGPLSDRHLSAFLGEPAHRGKQDQA